MKKLIALFAVMLASTLLMASTSSPIKDCKCKGIPLYGSVEVVKYAPADFYVHVVDYAPADLYVEVVNYPSKRCGEWQFVDTAGDFTVQFVPYGGHDFTIQYVDAIPGVY